MKKVLAGFCLVIAGGACVLTLVRPVVVGTPAQAQSSAVSTGGGGRYQMLAPNPSTIAVIDTATGNVRVHNLVTNEKRDLSMTGR